MTISFKKINSMIDSDMSIQELSEQQRRVLGQLCTQIYTIESSLDKGGSHQIVSDIKGEISLKAGDFQE